METDLDDILALLPMRSIVTELAQEIERMRLEAGITTEEMLNDLRKQRERYYKEKYLSGKKDHPSVS